MPYYKLDENKNVVKSSLEEWATFIEGEANLPANYRIIGNDTICCKRVSTVFLGMCWSFHPDWGFPLVFETMVFDEKDCGIYQRRYSTWEDAELGHERAIQWVKEELKNEHGGV